MEPRRYRGFLDAGVKDDEFILFSEMMNSKSLVLVANVDTVYTFGFLDLTQGPLVLEVPPQLLGLINDAWFRWVTDVSAVPVPTAVWAGSI